MSTHPNNRTRPRRAYDPSPSPTLVASRSPSESTVSLPRYNTAGGEPRQAFAPTDEHRQKLEDGLAKVSIVVGVFSVLAGVIHLRKSRKNRRSDRRRDEYESAQQREWQRREREQGARFAAQREFDEWREQAARPRVTDGYSTNRKRIDYPSSRRDPYSSERSGRRER